MILQWLVLRTAVDWHTAICAREENLIQTGGEIRPNQGALACGALWEPSRKVRNTPTAFCCGSGGRNVSLSHGLACPWPHGPIVAAGVYRSERWTVHIPVQEWFTRSDTSVQARCIFVSRSWLAVPPPPDWLSY